MATKDFGARDRNAGALIETVWLVYDGPTDEQTVVGMSRRPGESSYRFGRGVPVEVLKVHAETLLNNPGRGFRQVAGPAKEA